MTDIAKLKLLTGEQDESLLSLLLDDSAEYVKAYTNRTYVPDDLKKTVRDMAVWALNRMGTEGESGRSEGGMSYSFADAPANIYTVLNARRLVRVVGHAFEKKQDSIPEP